MRTMNDAPRSRRWPVKGAALALAAATLATGCSHADVAASPATSSPSSATAESSAPPPSGSDLALWLSRGITGCEIVSAKTQQMGPGGISVIGDLSLRISTEPGYQTSVEEAARLGVTTADTLEGTVDGAPSGETELNDFKGQSPIELTIDLHNVENGGTAGLALRHEVDTSTPHGMSSAVAMVGCGQVAINGGQLTVAGAASPSAGPSN